MIAKPARFGGIPVSTWVGWVGGVFASSICGTAIAITFAYGNFETKDHAIETRTELSKTIDQVRADDRDRAEVIRHYLERIETKVDALTEK